MADGIFGRLMGKQSNKPPPPNKPVSLVHYAPILRDEYTLEDFQDEEGAAEESVPLNTIEPEGPIHIRLEEEDEDRQISEERNSSQPTVAYEEEETPYSYLEEETLSPRAKIHTVVPTQFLSDTHHLAIEEIDGSSQPRYSYYSERMTLHPSKTHPRIPCTSGDPNWCEPPNRDVQLDCPDRHQMVGINQNGNKWNVLPPIKR
jgi:hypothetical protein